MDLFEHDEGGKELSYPIYDDRKEDDDNVNIYLVLVESLMVRWLISTSHIGD